MVSLNQESQKTGVGRRGVNSKFFDLLPLSKSIETPRLPTAICLAPKALFKKALAACGRVLPYITWKDSTELIPCITTSQNGSYQS